MPKIPGIELSDALMGANAQKIAMSRPTYGFTLGEKLVINNGEIEVTYIERRGSKARLYINAPNYVILRAELGRPSPNEKSPGGEGLVLSRNVKKAEGIYIGPDILIQALPVSSHTRIAIRTTAPCALRVDRGQVHEAILRELRQKVDDNV